MQAADAASLLSQGAHEFGSRGLLRLNGSTLNKEAASCFIAAGADANYRLGNECDNKARLGIDYRYHPVMEGPYLKVVHEVEAKWRGAAPRRGGILQSYVELGNVADSEARFWVGKRKHQRSRIYLNNYYYLNRKGRGLGVYDVPAGPWRLAYTYMRDARSPDVNGLLAGEQVIQSSHDLGLSDVAGKLQLDFRHSRIEGRTVASTMGPVVLHGAQGWAFSLQYGGKGQDVRNKAAIQYGSGASRAAWSRQEESAGTLGRLDTAAAAAALEASHTWRLLDNLRVESERWRFMGDIVAEWRDSFRFDGAKQSWFSVGGRYTRFIDAHWQASGEMGCDRVNGAAGSGQLLKATLALEWAPSPEPHVKPALRVYVTHAGWSGTSVGSTGGAAYARDTQAWSGGVEAEYRW